MQPLLAYPLKYNLSDCKAINLFVKHNAVYNVLVNEINLVRMLYYFQSQQL
jgi:hypothetical protein